MDFENAKIIFHKILFRELAPWFEKNKPIEKFADQISEITKNELDFYPRYKINFPYRSFNHKTTYYSEKILNESIAFCNEVFHLLENETDLRVKKYWRNEILVKKIPGWLIELGTKIKEKQYSIDYINPQKYTFDIDEDHKTETYIMQLLKVALMWCYLEIQHFFSFIPPEELFIEEDFYTRFLFEPVPSQSFLLKFPQVINIPEQNYEPKPLPIAVEPQKTYKPKFNPISDDNRPLKKGVASYHDIIRKPERFSSFEEQLYLNEYIDYKYSFSGKHKFRNQLALIYHLLIIKNYFNSFNDTTKKKITPRDIVKFLNHRYDVDIDKQFRQMANEPEVRAKFVESSYWLSNLPFCETR